MLCGMSSDIIDTKTRILAVTWRLMEKSCGQGVRMSDIANEAGISRQAVYLHFSSRTELMIATAQYVDEVRGLNERLKPFRGATGGIESLELFVEFWGNYIPEIYGMAKVLLKIRDTDEAAAAAWEDRMNAVREACEEIMNALDRDKLLASEWSKDDAVEILWTMLSVYNWEQLTVGCGWSTSQYILRMKTLLKRTFVDTSKVSPK